MNKELINKTITEDKNMDSREVADMMGIEHSKLLRMLEGDNSNNNSRKTVGIIPVLGKANVGLSNYFIKSTYKAGTREYKCYLCTKLGCDMLGNKLQGEKVYYLQLSMLKDLMIWKSKYKETFYHSR